MRFCVLTLFPEMVDTLASHSILGRAIANKQISLTSINIRDFSNNKHKHIDDYPYGGGAGMVMQAMPIYEAHQNALTEHGFSKKARVVYMTPQGKPLTQVISSELSKEDELIILCGHYEGVDERVIEEIVTDEISIGDYVLTGGELPALVLIDSIARLRPNVLGKEESFMDESFTNNLLEYPQYTRPKIVLDREVPEVLLSGNHEKIKNWRLEKSLERTKVKRPDLLK